MGALPVQTLQAHVDYGFTVCRTSYGAIGVKVWVYLGRYGEEVAQEQDGARRPSRRGKL
jgi:small subunit ribosomal protein S3